MGPRTDRLAARGQVLLVATLGAVLVSSGCSGFSRNEVLQAAVSPDGLMKAVAFQRRRAPWSRPTFDVSILRTDAALPQSAGNVFSCRPGQGTESAGAARVLRVRWERPDVLTVVCPRGATVLFRRGSYKGIGIHLAPDAGRAPDAGGGAAAVAPERGAAAGSPMVRSGRARSPGTP